MVRLIGPLVTASLANPFAPPASDKFNDIALARLADLIQILVSFKRLRIALKKNNLYNRALL